jgi:2-desacetyl-2-hydroxyethyl bacteriochlorophyllide A dehydrogenase
VIAALLVEVPAEELELAEIPPPLPGPGEVLVEVSACGVCGTDLHIMAGESYRPELPFVLGHELVGTVVAAGDEVSATWAGRKVAVAPFRGCGSCPPCKAGDERLCERGPLISGVLGRNGGFAAQAAVATAQLVEVPRGAPDEVVASLVDAGATARNAVRCALAWASYTEPRHLVLGGGPVGLLAAEMVLAASQAVEVVELNPLRREALTSRGMPAVPNLSDLRGTFSTVVDCAGSASLVQAALELLEPHGLYVSVGYSRVPELDLALLARRELSVKGVRSGRRDDLEHVIAQVLGGEIEPPPVETWPLNEINDALRSLRKGSVASKAVIVVAPGTEGELG